VAGGDRPRHRQGAFCPHPGADVFRPVLGSAGDAKPANGGAERSADRAVEPRAYTITVANAANYNDDLGVYYTAGGANAGIGTTSGVFQRVAAPSQAGQYSVNFATGVYTFASADATAPVLISYTYNVTGTGYKWRSPISCSAPRRPLR